MEWGDGREAKNFAQTLDLYGPFVAGSCDVSLN